MIQMLAVVLVVLAVLFVVFGRRGRSSEGHAGSAVTERSSAGLSRPSDLERALDRAVANGLLTRDVADQIIAGEVRAAPARAPGEVSAVTESIGYVGAILTIVGVVVLVGQFWSDMTTWSRLAVLGAVTLILWLVGLALRDEEQPVIWRMRGFIWLLAVGALSGFTAALVVDALEWTGESVPISIGAATAAFSAALWQLKDRPAQQLTTLAGLLVFLSGMMALVDGAAAIGLAVAAVGGAWFAVGSTGRLPPKLAAVSLGLLALLVGPAITTGQMGAWEKVAPVIGLVIATTLIGLGARLTEFVVTGAGVLGVFAYLPWTLGALFGDAIGAPAILLTSGVLLLTVMLVLLRRGHGPRRPSGGPSVGAGPTRPALG